MTQSALFRVLGVEFPLLAFSNRRGVVASDSHSGESGVFGAAGCTLEKELAWIDARVNGRP